MGWWVCGFWVRAPGELDTRPVQQERMPYAQISNPAEPEPKPGENRVIAKAAFFRPVAIPSVQAEVQQPRLRRQIRASP